MNDTLIIIGIVVFAILAIFVVVSILISAFSEEINGHKNKGKNNAQIIINIITAGKPDHEAAEKPKD